MNYELTVIVNEIETKNLRLARDIDHITEVIESDENKKNQLNTKAIVVLSCIQNDFIELSKEYNELESKYKELRQKYEDEYNKKYQQKKEDTNRTKHNKEQQDMKRK